MTALVKHAWRSWKRAKAMAAVAIAALALGIGSTTAIYSVIQAVLLKPLPYDNAERFYIVFGAWTTRPGWFSAFSYPDAQDFQARTRTTDAFGCLRQIAYNVVFNGKAVRLEGSEVMPQLFPALGIAPSLGRWYTERDGLNVALISARLWQQYGSDPAIVGKTITMDGVRRTIVGVMPAWFRLPPDAVNGQIWVPLHPAGDQLRRDNRYLICMAKVRGGVSREQFTADMVRIASELEREHPVEEHTHTATVVPLLERISQGIRPTLLLLLGSAIALLLITCANVSGLLLARTVTRTREIAVRVALGARRTQLATQFLVEGLMVALAGAGAGCLLSFVLIRVVLSMAANNIPRADQVTVDRLVLLFALGLAIVCGVLFSMAPLWQASRTPPREVLSDGTRASAGKQTRGLLRTFVIAEVALAFGLIGVAGILAVKLGVLRSVNPGFDPHNLTVMYSYSPNAKYGKQNAIRDHLTRMLDGFRRIPGVESVGFTSRLPLTGWGENSWLVPEAQWKTMDTSQLEVIEQRFVSPGYFATMRIPLIAGREFTERDVENLQAPMAMIINETTAHILWPRGNALGAYAHSYSWNEARFRIVGIVSDVCNAGLANNPRPEMYYCYRQVAMESNAWVFRSRLEPEQLARQAAQRAAAVDPEQAIFGAVRGTEIFENSLLRERLQSSMVSFFGASALLLAMLGVYGAVSYAVRQRTSEIGTRMALGATSSDLLRLVVGDGLKMAAIGVAIGSLAVFLLTRLVSDRFLEVKITNYWLFVVATLLVGGLTVCASLFPAWRATLISPLIAIRNEPGSMWQTARESAARFAEGLTRFFPRDDHGDSARESRLLAEIAEVSRSATSYNDAVRAALRSICTQVGAGSAALLVQRQPSSPYRCIAVFPDSCSDHYALPSNALLVSRLANYGDALPLDSREIDGLERWASEHDPNRLDEVAALREFGVRLAIRVAVRREVTGVLLLGAPSDHEKYTAADRRVLRGAAGQIALLIENSRLTERIVEQERLRRELLLAAEVQKRLFPEQSPATRSIDLAGVCIPARGVGGDYYDFLELGNRNIGIALADVAGKGIAAALIMSVVQASLRSLAGTNGQSLADLAARMNRLLHRSTGSNSYATFFYAQIDEENRKLRYVNAGHNPPYLIRNGVTQFVASSAPIEELPASGTIIGMFANSTYEEAELQLEPGDVLIAFTDGVVEALNIADEEFGEDRLKELLRRYRDLSVNEMSSRILADLKNWIGEAAQYDDLTFIVMKVVPPGLS